MKSLSAIADFHSQASSLSGIHRRISDMGLYELEQGLGVDEPQWGSVVRGHFRWRVSDPSTDT